MDLGEIDEESILENKPAIKNYWESKMRENSVSQFARSNFGVPNTTIIDKINDEIREDYLRNLELMNDEGLPRSSASDTSDEPIEFDSFDMASSNGSSPFGQPNHASSPLMMSESPTMIDSGHQSQESHAGLESEMEPETISLQTEPLPQVETDGRSSFYTTGSPIYKGFRNNAGNPNFSSHQQPPISQPIKPGQVSKVPSVGGLNNYRSLVETKPPPGGGRGKIENHVTHYIAFNKTFARTVKPHDDVILEREKSPPKSTGAESILEEKFASLSSKLTLNEVLPRSTKSDVSYILATSRLKKEIEDNMKREKELKDQGRVKTLSVETVSPTKAEIAAEMQLVQESSKESKVKQSVVIIPEETPVVIKEEVKKPNPIIVQQSIIPKKETFQPQTPTKGNIPKESFQEVTSPQQSIQNIIPNFKIGKNFNTLERYIMHSSLTKRNRVKSMSGNEGLSPMVTNASFDFELNEPVDSSIFNKKPLSNFPAEEQVSGDEEPVEKVRKNYIPTEKRIQNELLEMVEREEELKKSRQQWKSTPNLSNFTEEEEDVKVAVPREAAVRINNEKRRRSALISKWEDMISKNSQ